jgi:membrane protein YdbS with pleckstrin-like domain
VIAQSFGSVDGWRAPSPRLLTLRRLEVGLTTLVLALAAAVAAALGAVVVGVACLAAVLVAGALTERTLKRRFTAWGYLERADDLLVRRGVLFSRLSVVPYGRMQFVDVTAGPFERSFGLATVRLHTAAPASDARIPGLELDEAARVRDRLAELGEAHLAGL